MIGDLPPMRPCAVTKRGEHELVVITREDVGLVLMACCACGAVRRLYADADVPLDDMDAVDIAHRIGADYLAASLADTETRS